MAIPSRFNTGTENSRSTYEVRSKHPKLTQSVTASVTKAEDAVRYLLLAHGFTGTIVRAARETSNVRLEKYDTNNSGDRPVSYWNVTDLKPVNNYYITLVTYPYRWTTYKYFIASNPQEANKQFEVETMRANRDSTAIPARMGRPDVKLPITVQQFKKPVATIPLKLRAALLTYSSMECFPEDSSAWDADLNPNTFPQFIASCQRLK